MRCRNLVSVIRLCTLGLMVSGLFACAHIEPTSPSLGPLRAALVESPSSLQVRADRGEASAQLSLSLALRYGFGGAPIDSASADALQRKATSQRGSTPITTYIAGLRGKPGRVSTIYLPRYEISPVTATHNGRCAAVIALGAQGPAAQQMCGGPESHAELRRLWIEKVR